MSTLLVAWTPKTSIMIEKCKYCLMEHDTGGPTITFWGKPMKSCPEMPERLGISLVRHNVDEITRLSEFTDVRTILECENCRKTIADKSQYNVAEIAYNIGWRLITDSHVTCPKCIQDCDYE